MSNLEETCFHRGCITDLYFLQWELSKVSKEYKESLNQLALWNNYEHLSISETSRYHLADLSSWSIFCKAKADTDTQLTFFALSGIPSGMHPQFLSRFLTPNFFRGYETLSFTRISRRAEIRQNSFSRLLLAGQSPPFIETETDHDEPKRIMHLIKYIIV